MFNEKNKWVIGKAFRFCGKYIIIYIMILISAAAFSFAINLVNKSIINELSSRIGLDGVGTTFIVLACIYMCIYFMEKTNGFIITFGSNFFKYRVDMIFHKLFMWRSNNTPQIKFYDNEFMEKYSFVGGNTSKISSFLSNLFMVIFVNAATVIFSIILFAMYEPSLIIYAVLITAGTISIDSYVSAKEYDLDKQQIEEQRFHDYYKSILTDKSSAKELRLYGTFRYFLNKWERVYNKLRIQKLNLAIKKTKLENLYTFVRIICRALAIVILIYGTYMKKYDIGTFVLLFGLIESCANQASNLSFVLAKGAYKDVKYLSDYYDYVAPLSNKEIEAILKGSETDGNLYFGPFEELSLENVSFRYEGSEKDAVHNVSFTLKKGEIVSLLGYNGSGKTTLSKIINGSLAPTSGIIKLNGIEINDSNRNKIFAYFGNTPQEFSRFSVSIRDYVGLGWIELIDNKPALEKAYNKADINDLITSYEARDLTMLGKEYDDEGIDLSGGQWQKLAIASGFMGDPEILLMDEPTASIDPLKEEEMIDTFNRETRNLTTIFISHRIGFARLADRIVMMKDGIIEEDGSHEKLVAQNGYYAKLFNTQKNLYEGGEEVYEA